MIEAILSLGGLGVLAAFGLGVASKKFAVKVDPKQEAILEALPGANCGGCGFPGCSGMAEAMVKGSAPISGCPVGGGETAGVIAKILGVEAETRDPVVARLLCKGGHAAAKEKYTYHGVSDCRAAALVAGGSKACGYGCLGFGTCMRACPFDAITMSPDGLPVIDESKCTSCGNCVAACPKKIIQLLPIHKKVTVLCSSHDKGAAVKKICTVGCIGCSLCKKVCPFEAIEMDRFLARVIPEKCRQCGLCVAKCPTKVIEDQLAGLHPLAVIGEKCDGCTECVKVCPVKAITGETGKLHVVDPEKCVGCRACVDVCPIDVIEMEPRAKVSR
ncbi:MAG: RnfABCDGE type electron transport complex subunit B [Deltaproteobacteria bacterium]|nr:RnfABCDGE type electron transport complex subunit B [Deltaproteobacteria bacterium]